MTVAVAPASIPAPLSIRVPQKKALLIAIEYAQLEGWKSITSLPGTHRDPPKVKNLLIDIYKWNPEDITILMDDGKHLDPTRANIIQAMKNLVADAQYGDQFVFMFSGHGGQVPDDNGDEPEDGLDEVIWPLDIELQDDENSDYQKNFIRDDDIRKILVNTLPANSQLVMLFDCCHSGTAADLTCANGDEYPMTPVVTYRAPGRILGNTQGLPSNYTITSTVQQDFTKDTNVIYSPMSRMVNKSKSETSNQAILPHVTSWSACKDSQLTIECEDGCFIAAFVNALRAKPTQTHSEMLKSVSRELEKITKEANADCRSRGFEYVFDVAKPQLGSLRALEDVYSAPLQL